jgi:hypothetical protein
MPSTNRRQFLVAAGVAGVTGLAGCSELGNSGRPDVDPHTGLTDDPSAELETEAVFLAGDAGSLPDPPETAASVADADVVLATRSADRRTLVGAFRDGKPVAFAGHDAQDALVDVLSRVGDDYTFGTETVRARPVDPVVAVPRGDTVATYTLVDEGGWDDPVLDGLGWALGGRVPDCRTFVPEHSSDSLFAHAGATHVAGRLETGEAYASRTTASVSRQEGDQYVRLRTTLHAEASDGYAVEEALREADLPDDQRLHEVWPNPHSQHGVRVANVSDTVRSRFGVEVTPDSARARSALTGCGGLQTEGGLAYDHRTSVDWKRDGLLGADRRYAEATGRGEWHLGA